MLPSCASRVLTRCSRSIVRRRRFSAITNPAIAQTGIASASAIRTGQSSTGHHRDGFGRTYRQIETRRTTQPSSVQSFCRAFVQVSAASDAICGTAERMRGCRGRTAAFSAVTSRCCAARGWTCPEDCGARTAAPIMEAVTMPSPGILTSERSVPTRP